MCVIAAKYVIQPSARFAKHGAVVRNNNTKLRRTDAELETSRTLAPSMLADSLQKLLCEATFFVPWGVCVVRNEVRKVEQKVKEKRAPWCIFTHLTNQAKSIMEHDFDERDELPLITESRPKATSMELSWRNLLIVFGCCIMSIMAGMVKRT